MRCLALAAGLQRIGAQVMFVCRALEGHLGDTITAQGCTLALLPAGGTDDAAETRAALHAHPAPLSWVVVDRYQSGAAWDAAMRPAARRLMVIDDLVDRPRDCDLMLNPNADDLEAAYALLVPARCRVLAGPRYALLRQEFADARREIAVRQIAGPALRLLVSLGGVDAANITSRVLAALDAATLAPGAAVTVLLGQTSPWIASVRAVAAGSRWPVDVRVGATDIAQLLLRTDLAVGAAGGSSWERCAVGVPSIAVVVADNQRAPARTLRERGAALVIDASEIESRLAADVTQLAADAGARARLSQASAALVDAQGVERIVRIMADAKVAA